jgi:PTS system galactitol-specific IIB component
MSENSDVKKYILISCGSGIATATLVGEKVREICRQHGINAEIQQCGIREITAKAPNVDIIVTTARYQGQPVNKPIINALPVLTGIGVESFEKKLLDALTG